MLGGTTIESGVTQCPLCDVRLEVAIDDPPPFSPYCCSEHRRQDLGLRHCPTCGEDKEGETFQPMKPSGEVACEDCASTCANCGQLEPDPDLIDNDGDCRWCRAKALVQCLRNTLQVSAVDVTAPSVLALCDLVEDLAPEVLALCDLVEDLAPEVSRAG